MFRTLEELKAGALSGEIKLEDLSVEDMLKFYGEGFLNTELANFFKVSDSELRRVRKQKGVTDAFFENEVRNIILLYDYVLEHYDITKEEFVSIIYPILFDVEHKNPNRRILSLEEKWLSIDWVNMDPKKEIEARGIDVQDRNDRYFVNFARLEWTFRNRLEEFIQEYKVPQVYVPKKREKTRVKASVIQRYSRDKEVAQRACKRAGFLCEENRTHDTFISKKNGLRYMEAHHLVPMEFQSKFSYSLDVEANIICLCSNCHNEIHYGINNKGMIKKFYDERKEDLKECGIVVTLSELYDMYDKILIKVGILDGEEQNGSLV